MGDNIPVRSTSSLLDYFPPISSNNSYNEVNGLMLDYDQRSCSSLGFMDLLNTQLDFGHSLFEDVISPSLQQTCTSIHESQPSKSPLIQESSSRPVQVLMINCNTPATPNSSSISNSESIGTGHENEELAAKEVVEGDQENKEDEVDDEEERQQTKKHLKSKKIIEKKQREPRFAFMTRSEVDHLEDGYRWRKYGQKAVKNSSFPRSYFRCTTASCNVKKRVERSFNDPSIVVTTYEGKHTHPSTGAAAPPPYSALSCGGAAPFPPELMLLSAAQQTHLNHSIPLSCGYMDSTNIMSFTVPAWLTDHGLVEEMVKRNELKY